MNIAIAIGAVGFTLVLGRHALIIVRAHQRRR